MKAGRPRRWNIGVKIRFYLNRAICSLRSCVMSRHLRGELRNRSRFSLFRISSQGPFPRIAPRIAHNVMRKRDHGLCVRGFCAGIGSQVIAPGGKWAGWLYEALRQAGSNKTRQHPAFRWGPFTGWKRIEMEERFESLEQQFNLPT